MARRGFPGGIQPPERKALSNQAALVEAPLPRRVILPLDQHIGLPAEPLVTLGQRVRTGEPIARAQGMISAYIHASITGTVSAIEEREVPHPSPAVGEHRTRCIIIDADSDGELEQKDDWLRMPPLDWHTSDDEALIERLRESGVIGLGGAGFPTAIKAQRPEDSSIDTLIVNAAECEPYITADDLTLRTYSADILEGARMFARLCGAKHVLVGIEDNKAEAIEALHACSHGDPLITIKILPARYPSGGEKQLVQLLTGREVPSRGLPTDVGALCHNPGTLLAALRAVRDGEPLISRIVTLTGEALTHPGNVEARLGTPMHELLRFAGLQRERLTKLIMGGPMMGSSLPLDRLYSGDLPMIKTSNCLIAGTTQEFPSPPPEQPCIRCGACETACPVSLLPQQLFWFASSHEHDKAELFNLFDCIECGACAYVCPSHIPLVDYYRAAKNEIRTQDFEARRAEHARHRFEFRQARLAREEAEKEARRRARAQRYSLETQQAPSPPSTAADEAKAQVRKLKIAQAAAKSAVKKAEKALARASETGEGHLDDLQTQLDTARENLQATESQLASAQRDATENRQDISSS